MYKVLSALLLSSSIFAQTITWERTTGPVGNSLDGIIQNSQGDLFTFGLSLYKMKNNSSQWMEIWDQTNAIMTSVAINSNDVIFVGTYWPNPFLRQQGAVGGLFRSMDNGESWVHLSEDFPEASVNDLQIGVNNQLFALTRNMLLRSINNGETWETLLIDSLENWDDFRVLEILPQDSLLIGTHGSGVLYSPDGANWALASGPESRQMSSFGVGVDGTVYATSHSGIFHSKNNGVTWNEIEFGAEEYYPGAIAINSKNEIFAATSTNLYKSPDAGESWLEVNSFGYFTTITEILINEDDEIYLGTSGKGVIFSGDDGDTWQPINYGLANASVQALVVNQDDILIAGTDGGLSYSENNGDTWHFIKQNLSPLYISRIAESPNGTLITGSHCPGDNNQLMLRSYDNGDNWEKIEDMYRCVLSLFIHNNGDILFSSSYFINGVYRSRDNGDTWETLDPQLVATDLAVNQNNTIFAATWDGFYRSDDDGQTWQLVKTTPDLLVGEIMINSHNHIFIAQSSNIQYEIYRSIDDGLTWTYHTLANDDTTRSKYLWNLFQDADGNIWAGTSHGVYLSKDNGDSWQQENLGLPGADVYTFDVNSNGVVFAGVGAHGVYRTTSPVVTNVFTKNLRPDNYILEQNFPNPFNPTTKITFTIPKTTFTKLTIYDILGREIRTLVNRELEAGRHEIDLNAENLPSGVYLYKIQSGEFTRARKMILVK